MIHSKSCWLARRALSTGQRAYSRAILSDNAFFKISPEVRDAVMGNRPVVALETTIYTHGFPHPQNIALSDHLEKVVRDHGAIPATIGVLNGIIRVGMSRAESHELFETARQPTTIKLSRRDLSYICGLGLSDRKLNGGTTIAGTMILAHLAGIRIFATGGLGGVHRGGEHSMDISADLTELGRTPVAVISSGCKSFLDLPRTLEYLETQGAGVATFSDGRGDSVHFPAFWARESHLKSPKTLRDEKEAAAIVYAQSKLGIESGLLFANPIPEENSIPISVMDKIIADAIQEAHTQGASGSDNTPFILDYIHNVSKGGSIKANWSLVENNVIRGSKVAVALADLEKGDEYNSSFLVPKLEIEPTPKAEKHPYVLVAGSLAIDLACNYKPIIVTAESPTLHTSNPASISQSLGGVGHNIAAALHYAGSTVRLCSPVANDLAGKAACLDLQSRGLDTSGIRSLHNNKNTPQYVAVNDQRNNLFIAMADMSLLEGSEEMFDELWAIEFKTSKPKWVVVDANWSKELIRKWVMAGRAVGAKIAMEPVSIQKSARLFFKTWKDYMEEHLGKGINQPCLADLVTPNKTELLSMVKHIRPESAWLALLSQIEDQLSRLLQSHIGEHLNLALESIRLLVEFQCVATKLGPDGVLLTELLFDGDPRLRDSQHVPHVKLIRDSPPGFKVEDAITLPSVDPKSSIAAVAGVYVRHFPSVETLAEGEIVSVNGAGDTFLGVLLAASLKEPDRPISNFVDIAQRASILTLKHASSVSPEIRGLLQ